MKTRGIHVALLLWLLIIRHVKTGGKLDIRFIRYSSDGRKISGECCDGGFVPRCPDKCDPKFSLWIYGSDGGNPHSLYQSTTDYIDNHNIIDFGSSIQGKANPFIIPVPKAIPSSIMILVQVYDHDGTYSQDHLDTLSKNINIQVAATEQTAAYTPYILKRRTELKIAVRAYCDTNWYGSTCEKYCKAIANHSHYMCHLQTGAKMCFEGWKGDNCDQDIDECKEIDNICQNGGSCRNTLGSFECICIEEIKGKRCENIINQCAVAPCLNGGTCGGNETAFNCACSVEWTGETCAEKVNFCDSAPCERGKCTPDLLTATGFKCYCDFGRVGERCSLDVDIVNITLLGEIDYTNRGDLADGLDRLITELGGFPGKVDVKFMTTSHWENNFTTTYIQLYSAVENGSFIKSPLLDKIFESNPDEVINHYLPLPLYPPREEEYTNTKSPHDSWDTNKYVSATLPPIGLVLMSVLLLVAFCIWRRRADKTQQCRDVNQLSAFVMDVACNPQPPGAMTGNVQEASVSPDGYTSHHFLEVESHDKHCGHTSNISLASEDMTHDPEGQQGFGFYPDDNARLGKAATCATHCDDTSNIHFATEDMTLDDVIVHCFRFSPDDKARLGDAATLDTNCDDTTKLHVSTEDVTHDQVLRGLGVSPDNKASLGDVATLQQDTEDLTLDPVILRDARASPHDNAGPGDEVATPETHSDEPSDALPTTEDGTLTSVRLQRPSGDKDDKPRLDTRRSVTSYIHPVPGDITLDAEKESEEEDSQYTVIDDNNVEDILQEHPYETIESLDDNDVENISQKDPYAKINL